MTDEQFARYWLEVHAPLAKMMPGLRRYVANLVQRPPNREPECSGIVELWFENRDAMKKAFASPEGKKTQEDSETFTKSLTTLFINEHPIMQ
jgi:uncharacterized protein (TIGR02118 family)